MPTMNVKDAAGSTVAIEKPNANGRAAAAASRPVVLATEDKAAIDALTAAIASAAAATQPVSAASLPLPTGAATDAGLAAIVTAIVNAAFYPATQPISASALPLPAGASTSAKQDAIIDHVDGIEAGLAAIGTRAYGAGQQVAIGAASAASTGLAATEVLLHASSRCFVRVATAATAGAGIPLEAGEKFHLRLTSGQQIHVIRDTADGFLNIVPVA